MPAGRWGDLFGHKKTFILGYVWFGVWSLASGFSVWSSSLIVFALFRALQGIGPAIILPNGIAILARNYPPGRRREVVLSIFGAAAPTGFVVGAVFSGIFSELVWWPWAYWVLGITLLVMAGLALFVVRHTPVAEVHNLVGEMDLTGTILGVTGLVLFNFAWNEGPSVGWEQIYVYVLLIIGVALLLIFLCYEFKISRHPLLPVAAFTTETSLVFGCISAGWASFGVWIFYLW